MSEKIYHLEWNDAYFVKPPMAIPLIVAIRPIGGDAPWKYFVGFYDKYRQEFCDYDGYLHLIINYPRLCKWAKFNPVD